VISAVILGTAGPATAQADESLPNLGCIPTSDTPFQTGVTHPGPYGWPFIFWVEVANPTLSHGFAASDLGPDGMVHLQPGLNPGFYAISALDAKYGFIFEQELGTLQIGGCLPTTLSQCRNDGWQQFGFKSQGRCVAFVILARICDALERHGLHLKFCPPTPPQRPPPELSATSAPLPRP
jgi:hypothetical protein